VSRWKSPDASPANSPEIAVRAANAIEKATTKVDNEIARESCRRAESQGGTTIIVGTTLLGLPNRAVSFEEEEEEEVGGRSAYMVVEDSRMGCISSALGT
jgi:hypothetical protein